MLTVKTYIAPSKVHGLGLFAGEPIPRGTVIWKFIEGFDHLLPRRFVESLPECAQEHIRTYCGLLINGCYLQTGDNDRYINHSNSPNISGVNLDDRIAACDIEMGDEITENYGTFDVSGDHKVW